MDRMSFRFDGTQIAAVLNQNGNPLPNPTELDEVLRYLSVFGGFNSGLLPPNTRYLKIAQNVTTIAIEVQAAKRQVAIRHDPHNHYGLPTKEILIPDVPFPSAAFIFKLNRSADKKYMISVCYIYALASSGLNSLDEKLYYFPTPNIMYGQTICWGYNAQAANKLSYHSLASIEGAVNYLYGAGFNDHVFHKDLLSKEFDWSKIPNVRNVELYFEQLRQAGSFDIKWLRPQNLTFAQALEKIQHG